MCRAKSPPPPTERGADAIVSAKVVATITPPGAGPAASADIAQATRRALRRLGAVRSLTADR